MSDQCAQPPVDREALWEKIGIELQAWLISMHGGTTRNTPVPAYWVDCILALIAPSSKG